MSKRKLLYALLFFVLAAGISVWTLLANSQDDNGAMEKASIEADSDSNTNNQADNQPPVQTADHQVQTQAPLLMPNYDVDVQRDIVYANKTNETDAAEPLMLDLYMPSASAETNRPVFVFIHGGGYTSGSRQDGAAYAEELAKRGYAVVAMDYRLKRDPFVEFYRTITDAFGDIEDVFDWIAANAEAKGLDASRIAIGGDSAGGYLAMNFVNQYIDQNDAVNNNVFAIVDIYGGRLDRPAHEQLPPMLIIHGTNDQVVPYTESLELRQELQQRGTYQTMLSMEGVGHDYKNEKYFDEVVGTTSHFLWNVWTLQGQDMLPESSGIEAVSGDRFELVLPAAYQADAGGPVEAELSEGWTFEKTGTDKLQVHIPAGLERGSRSVVVSQGGDVRRFAVNVKVLDALEPQYETIYDPKKRAVLTRLLLTNRSANPFNGSLLLRYEKEGSAQGEYKANISQLESGGSAQFNVAELVQGQRSLEIEDATGQLVQRTESMFHVLLAHKASSPVQIDGNLADWKGEARFEASKVVMDGWNGEADTSAFGYMSWDNKKLYVAMDVTDDTHVQQANGDAIWGGDSVQLAIGIADDDGGMASEYSELGVAADGSGTLSQWRWIAPSGFLPGDAMEIEKAVSRTEGHTIYELAIPWDQLTIDTSRLKLGAKLKFSLLVNDNDGTGRKGWIEYNSGIGRAKDIHLFGDVYLEE